MITAKILFDKIIVSANKENVLDEKITMNDENSASFSEEQEILVLSDYTRELGLAVGDKVVLNVSNFAKRKMDDNSIKDVSREYYEVKLPLEIIDDTLCMVISSRDIKYFKKK